MRASPERVRSLAMRPAPLFALLVACTTTSSLDAATDTGADAPSFHDAGVDGGFDAASIPPCTLPAPTPFPLAPHTLLANGMAHGLSDRDFYVLTVLELLPNVASALSADASVASIATTRDTALHSADVSTCDPSCVQAALVRTDDAAAIDATIQALTTSGHLAAVATELRSTDQYERFVEANQDDATLVRTALTEAMANLADAFMRYAIGELPPAMLGAVVHGVASAAPGSLAWWQPLSRVTTMAMIADGRDEAVRYEPLRTGENAAAIAAIATTNFSHYPYVAILVPGEGPTDLVTPLNPVGAMRCDIAVARFRAGLAPFLLVSGGHVHPDRTHFSEAIQMKQYLMTTYAVPESAIIVDPYARHTTTNLRNTVRELFAYGAPTDGRVLVVSDILQSVYIASDALATRCDAELFYRPFLGLQVLTPNDSCITMAPASLTIAASDALDP
jgi:hypothetical protein